MPDERSPRLLVCTDTYPPQVNGVSVVTALTVSGLAARGWTCAVVQPQYPGANPDPFQGDPAYEASARGLVLPSMPLPGYPDLRLAWPGRSAIARCLATFRPHLVHCATEFVIGTLGQRAARRAGIPVTTSYHTDFGRYTEAYGMSALRPAVTRHLTRFHQQARVTFTPSRPACDDLRSMGVPHGEVWGCGVDTSLFHPRHRDPALRTLYGGPDACLFLHVGRLAPEKGVERILQAFHQARAQAPEVPMHLVVAGSGPREAALRALNSPDVTFLPNLDRRTVLPQLYASADAFLFSSLTETLGLVVLEAMASALPVVATAAGGVADHLQHEVNGLAYPAGDVPAMTAHLVHLARDHARRRRLGAAARRYAEHLGWDRELDRLDARYREITAGVTSGR